MPVLVNETTLQVAVPDTAAELLQAYPNSPYTALLVSSSDHISCFDQHCTRLASGLSKLTPAVKSTHVDHDLSTEGSVPCKPVVGNSGAILTHCIEKPALTAKKLLNPCLRSLTRTLSPSSASGIVSADLRDRVLSAVQVAVSYCRSQEQLKGAATHIMVTVLIDNRLGCSTHLIDSKHSSFGC